MSRCMFCNSPEPPDSYSIHACRAMHYDCLLKAVECSEDDEFLQILVSGMKLVALTCETEKTG